MLNCKCKRHVINNYPKNFYLILNIIDVIFHIVLGMLINSEIGYNEWQLYGLIYSRAFNMLVTFMSPMIISLGIVSYPKFSQTWQIVFTIFLSIPVIGTGCLYGFLKKSDVEVKNQMEFLSNLSSASELLPFFYLELTCSEDTENTNSSCVNNAISHLKSGPMKKFSLYGIILLSVDIIVFASNLFYLLLCKTSETVKHFDEDSPSCDPPVIQ